MVWAKQLHQDLNVILPVASADDAAWLAPLAAGLAGAQAGSRVRMLAVTRVPADASLSDGALRMQRLRAALDALSTGSPELARWSDSAVSHDPWQELERWIDERADDHDLLLLPWMDAGGESVVDPMRALADPPCDIAVASRGARVQDIRRILLPLRGGPYAGLALQIAIRLARTVNAEITLLRVLSPNDDELSRALRRDFAGVAGMVPEVTEEIQVVGDPMRAIERELRSHQAVVLGASAAAGGPAVGSISRKLLAKPGLTTLVVRTKQPFRLPSSSAQSTPLPVSVRVDKWFAENTFACSEFADIRRLVGLKRDQGCSVSLALPALNEEATIGRVIDAVLPLRHAGLLDEIVVIDSHSTDRTREIARGRGLSVFVHQDVLPETGARRGKGEALWKSLAVTRGDIVAWIDTDIINPHPRFVYGIVGPLIANARIQYVKGFYQRPISVEGRLQSSGGGRVTELLARPMFNLFFPELSGFVQPLAGEYAGRRSALERVPFYSGYGVETGLLLDLLRLHGLGALAQVDLQERVHRNQELQALSKMSFALLQVFFDHLQSTGVIDPAHVIEPTMKLLRIEDEGLKLEEVDIHERMRPPMADMTGYWRHAAAEVAQP